MTVETRSADNSESIEMPAPTAAPLVISVGVLLIALGVATSAFFIVVGVVLLVAGIGRWIGELLPGRGHLQEPLASPELRPQPVVPSAAGVEKLRRGMAGYRLRLPVRVHPVSAGVKGGLVGGLVMPLPALLYGVLSGHGIWMPVNLLAGIVLPGVGDMGTQALREFHSNLLVWAIAIHAVVSLIMGLMYGVLMPTLPDISKPIAWGALLMPVLWSAVSFFALGQMNPEVRQLIEWPWFILSQFIFGMIAAIVFTFCANRNSIVAGLLGGAAGGLLMPIPAILWSVAAGHGIWYPVNLLAAMVQRHASAPSLAELQAFHPEWLGGAVVLHIILSLSFGLAFALVLPRVPAVPSSLAWGGLVLPLLWTGMSYGLMGVVNPALQERVDWPWFIASQFVFGVVAAIVVNRLEQIYIPPAGQGRDRAEEFLAG